MIPLKPILRAVRLWYKETDVHTGTFTIKELF